jgi:hypothetical protein
MLQHACLSPPGLTLKVILTLLLRSNSGMRTVDDLRQTQDELSEKMRELGSKFKSLI